MATPFDRLMETVRPHLPGAMDEAIRQELFLVCDEFFTRTDLWTEEQDFVVRSGSKTGEIMPFSGRIIRLLGVEHDDRPVRGVYLGDIDSSGISTVIMPHHETHEYTYRAKVSLTVADPVSRDAYPIVPVAIVTQNTSALVHGILGRMMMQPSKPYSNMGLAQVHTVKFRGEASRAKNEAKAGKTAGSQAWSFPQTHNRRK